MMTQNSMWHRSLAARITKLSLLKNPEQILWVPLQQHHQNRSSFSGKLIIMQKKKGEKGKKRKCEKHSKENSREVQLNLLLFAHTWKDFTEFCELRDWLKYLFNVVVLSVLVVVVIDNKLNSLWEVHQFHQIWSDYAPLTSCSKL